MNTLQATEVRDLFNYDPETGVLTWRQSRGQRTRAGSQAGTLNREWGGIQIETGNKVYGAHQLAWVHYYGTQPTGKIYHIDGNRTNNRIANLADAPLDLFRTKKEPLTTERLRELMTYHPDTGLFTWNIVRGAHKHKPSACIRNDTGYVVVRVDRRLYRAHRLAWLYTYGDWPKGDIDHINGDRSDNRLANLRGATRSQNSGNLRKLLATNTSGHRGVVKARDKWIAQIVCNGQAVSLGTYDTKEEAAAAYKGAAIIHFGEYYPDAPIDLGQEDSEES